MKSSSSSFDQVCAGCIHSLGLLKYPQNKIYNRIWSAGKPRVEYRLLAAARWFSTQPAFSDRGLKEEWNHMNGKLQNCFRQKSISLRF